MVAVITRARDALQRFNWEKGRRWWMLAPLALVVGLVFWALHGLLHDIAYADIIGALRNTDAGILLLALCAALVSYAALTGYDASSLRYVGARVPPRFIVLTSFVAFALGNNVGLGALSGGAVRMRLYSAAGVDASLIMRAIVFNMIAFGLGLCAVSAIGLMVGSDYVSPVLHVPAGLLNVIAIILLLLVSALVITCYRKRELRIGRRWKMPLPTGHLALIQLVISCTEIFSAAMVLWFLLPHDNLAFGRFLACYAIGLTAGVISHVPGGLGVFETILMVSVGDAVPREQLAAALILYRCIYFLLPLGVSLLLLGGFELRKGIAAPVARAATRLSPLFLAVFVLVVAIMLLLSGALPATDEATTLLALQVPLPLVEASHLISSLAGLLLLFVVRGILQRLDAAWWAALFISTVALVLSLPKGISLLEMALLGFLASMLIISRHEFDRRASLFSQRFSGEWWLLVASVIALMMWVLFFAYRDVGYAHQLWWQFEFDAHAPRSMRAALAIILAFAAVAFWQMFRPSPMTLTRPSEADLQRASRILTTQSRAETGLALMGDKHFLFSASGNTFLMFGTRARSLVSLFDPVGPESEWEELVWRFRELADERGVRAAFYQVRPQHLTLYLDAGFRVYKLGEYAWVPLAEFSLKGARRANLRHGCSRAERQGLQVEVIAAEQTRDYMSQLQDISNAWLNALQLNEKGFSLGAFNPEYIARQPVALVRQGERILAFATLLVTDAHEEVSVDLMRYIPSAPPGTMEYLFAQLMLHFKAQGYHRFGLGMAPLSGMAEHPLAPAWHRVARLIFDHGESLYNFQGLRSFKDKFAPEWEARYLAANGGISAVKISIDIAALISGSLRKVVLQ